jgi:hypothetical protein
MQPGDIIVMDSIGSWWLYPIEQLLYGDYWGHTGIYIGNNEVIEAIPSGVTRHDIEQADGFWRGAHYYLVLRLSPGVAPASKAQAAADVAKQQKGKPYNFFFDKNRTDMFYCTHLVWYSYKQPPDPVDLESRQSPCQIIFGPKCPSLVGPGDIVGTKDIGITYIVDSLLPVKAVAFYVDDAANLYITNPSGHHAGYDPVTHQDVNEMPDQAFYSGSSAQIRVLTVNNMEGQWDIKLIGTTGGSYTFASAPVSDSSQRQVVTGSISPGQVIDYPITYPPQISQPCPGDANGDGVVNAVDLSILASEWGRQCTSQQPCRADFNHDGIVNAVDLSILAANWGRRCS